MRIAQIVLDTASAYERKCQRADAAALAGQHEVLQATLETIGSVEADVAHVYAGVELPRTPFRRFPLPYVSSAGLPRARWFASADVAPGHVIAPLPREGARVVPEAVEDVFWTARDAPRRSRGREAVIGTYRRPSILNSVDQAWARITRFRNDVTWSFFDAPPTPEDLAGVDLWVDPAMSDDDFDGFAAEALTVGTAVVATRTAINRLRLEEGRTGFLVPPRDPNEMTHAILAALFKPEVAESKNNAARQTASKFRARHRIRVLVSLYETLIS